MPQTLLICVIYQFGKRQIVTIKAIVKIIEHILENFLLFKLTSLIYILQTFRIIRKFVKYFIKNYSPKSIISYCDNSKFSGNVYNKIGMSLISKGSPQCHWSKDKKQITQNLLNQRGFDQLFGTNYGKGTSNRELMIQNGWSEVYDCGQSSYKIEF